ncbi:MAG: hypothetical protein V4539_14010 [Bacteroidota bacterium]
MARLNHQSTTAVILEWDQHVAARKKLIKKHSTMDAVNAVPLPRAAG